jgi:hypothetical protein
MVLFSLILYFSHFSLKWDFRALFTFYISRQGCCLKTQRHTNRNWISIDAFICEIKLYCRDSKSINTSMWYSIMENILRFNNIIHLLIIYKLWHGLIFINSLLFSLLVKVRFPSIIYILSIISFLKTSKSTDRLEKKGNNDYWQTQRWYLSHNKCQF